VSGEVCIANIGTAQRNQRKRLGAAALAAGALVFVVAPMIGLAPWSHPVSALLLYGGFTGIFQARGHT
jgi:hypothetical protein